MHACGARSTCLVHEVRDDPVEVQSVVEAGVDEVDEIGGGDGHAIKEDLGLHDAHLRQQAKDVGDAYSTQMY